MDTNNGNGTTAPAQVSLSRLYFLRVGYLILAVGLAVVKWPLIINHAEQWTLMEGAVNSMLTALSAFMFLGVRYPLQMLPVLQFEAAWKLIWLTVVALPLWTTGQIDPATRSMTYDLLWVVIPLVAIPWRYVFAQYVTKHGDRWRPDPSRPANGRLDGAGYPMRPTGLPHAPEPASEAARQPGLDGVSR